MFWNAKIQNYPFFCVPLPRQMNHGVFQQKFAVKQPREGIMQTLGNIPDGQHNSLAVNAERMISVCSGFEKSRIGKSVGYVLHPDALYWFPIRATYHRAQKVYEKLVALNDGRFELYLPMLCQVEYANEGSRGPVQQIKEEPLDKGLLFMRSTIRDFRALVQTPSLVPGLTPYYNHFTTNEFGRNDYLVVPDRQMESFKIIVESRNKDILVNQKEMPQLIEGDQVMVTDGPFAGVEGVVMKYKHQKRVFVELKGVGRYATAYVPGAWIKKV